MSPFPALSSWVPGSPPCVWLRPRACLPLCPRKGASQRDGADASPGWVAQHTMCGPATLRGCPSSSSLEGRVGVTVAGFDQGDPPWSWGGGSPGLMAALHWRKGGKSPDTRGCPGVSVSVSLAVCWFSRWPRPEHSQDTQVTSVHKTTAGMLPKLQGLSAYS